MIVNFVISEDKASRIFSDIFRRFMECPELRIVVSERPVEGCDIHHYHRPQMEAHLYGNAVVTVHHDLEDPDPFVDFELFRARYREAQRIVCLNTLQRDFLEARGYAHTTIIPHGYDSALFRKRTIRKFDPAKKICLGITSKRYPRRFKGEVLLYALLDRMPRDRVRFLLVGEGRSEDAVRMRQLGFEVAVHEVLPYRLFPAVYEEIDFLLMVSTFEGGPANLPEAVASGTPVLATLTGMVPDMIRDGENGLMLSREPAEDAQRLIRLFANENGIYDRLMEGAGRVMSAISWEQVIARYIAVYSQLVRKGKVETALAPGGLVVQQASTVDGIKE